MHNSHKEVEITCQCSLIDAACAKLQDCKLSFNNVDVVCDCRRLISIPIPNHRDHYQEFKVLEMLINRDLDFSHASLHLEPLPDQPGHRGCAHTAILQ